MATITNDAEAAGRTISVLMSALAIPVVYGIAAAIHGRRVALAAAALVAVNPYLIAMSTTVFIESTYLTAILGTILLLLRALASPHPNPRAWLAAGGVAGLAYLLRPEALAYTVCAVAVLAFYLIARRLATPAVVVRIVALAAAAFLVVAAPYVAWLSAHSGELRVEGKTPLNVATQLAIDNGAAPLDATFGVDANAQEVGIWNRPNGEVLGETSISASDVAKYVVKRAPTVVKNAAIALKSDWIGSLPLLALSDHRPVRPTSHRPEGSARDTPAAPPCPHGVRHDVHLRHRHALLHRVRADPEHLGRCWSRRDRGLGRAR